MATSGQPAPPLSVPGAWAALRWPTTRDLALSVKAAMAVVIALAIGFSQNLENPYWSALTIYVLVAQPESGAIRTKALFRLAGTLIGGTSAILLGAAFGSHVGVLLCVAIALIVLTNWLKLLDRTPANYTWFATSLTIAVIAVVHVQQPDTLFAYGTARMVEISLGILAIGIVDAVFWPRTATPAFLTSMQKWHGGAAAWVDAALDPAAETTPDARWDRRKRLRALAAALGPLDMAGVQLPYDPVATPPRGRDLDYLRLVFGHLVAHLTGANTWIEASRADPIDGGAVEAAAAEVRAWIGERHDFADPAIVRHAEAGRALARRIATRAEPAPIEAGRDAVLCATVIVRLTELVEAWATIEDVLHAMATGGRLPRAERAAARAARPQRHVDYLLAAVDTAPLALSMSVIAAIWYATAWTGGINAMLFAFIPCAFVSGTPGATRSAGGVVLWVSGAFALTFLYQFAILPRVTDFVVLATVLSIALVPLGLLVAMGPFALLTTANVFAFLGLQTTYAADFATTFQNLVASLAGCCFAYAALRLFSFDRPGFRARRIAEAMRRDIVDAARVRHLPDRGRFLSLSVDRLVQFFGIVATRPAGDPLHGIDLARRLRVAANVALLRTEERALPPAPRAAVRTLVRTLGDAYARIGDPDRTVLLSAIERCYAALLDAGRDAYRPQALIALTGLRVALTPDPGFEARMARGD